MASKISEETKKALDEFSAKDAEFQQAWTHFEQLHEGELIRLEVLRENRNASLEVATKTLREEADEHDEKVIKYGPFTAMKKESKCFHADMILARITERDLYDDAITAGALEEKVTVKYAEMKQFLEDRKIYDDFEDCEDSAKLTTAISGPKTIAAMGTETKRKK